MGGALACQPVAKNYADCAQAPEDFFYYNAILYVSSCGARLITLAQAIDCVAQAG
jgi:hypothetical protein